MFFYISLAAVSPIMNQSFSFSIFYPATFSFMTNTSNTDFTDLVKPLLQCLQCSRHRQLGCWPVSSWNFLPHHFIVPVPPPVSWAVLMLYRRRAKAVPQLQKLRWCQEWNSETPGSPSQRFILLYTNQIKLLKYQTLHNEEDIWVSVLPKNWNGKKY